MTDDPDIRIASSMMDYIFRRLALDHLPYEQRASLGIFTAEERAATVADTYDATPAVSETAPVPAKQTTTSADDRLSGVHSTAELLEKITGQESDAPLCMTCGIKMQRSGSCYVCTCGLTSGCS